MTLPWQRSKIPDISRFSIQVNRNVHEFRHQNQHSYRELHSVTKLCYSDLHITKLTCITSRRLQYTDTSGWRYLNNDNRHVQITASNPLHPTNKSLSSSSSSSLLACTTRMRSTQCCQQLPKWAVLSHMKYVSQCDVVGFQVVLYILKPCDDVCSNPLGGAQT